MKKRHHWGPLAVITMILLLASTAPGWAIFEKEILQAVHDGYTNSGSNRVVVAELTAGDW